MNDLSAWLFGFFGLLFGFVFQDLLEELGVDKKLARSWIAVFALALIPLVAYWLQPLFTNGTFAFVGLEKFTESPLFRITVALFIGAAARILLNNIFKRGVVLPKLSFSLPKPGLPKLGMPKPGMSKHEAPKHEEPTAPKHEPFPKPSEQQEKPPENHAN